MKKINLLLLFCGLLMWQHVSAQKSQYFEMRTYTAHEGKRPDLIKRFQDHTLKLFKKNGIENIAYMIPNDESDNRLVFIIGYPDEASRDRLWNQFANSPEWQAAFKASEANGPLVKEVQQTFMTKAPELNPKKFKSKKNETRVFELRTYHLHPGRVDAINARFRDHTQALFEKHGMTNATYWYTVEKGGEQTKLVYLLAHKDEATGKESFKKFGADPAWIFVRDASEEDGKIVQKVESLYMKTLPFSPMK
jgi:hypothetical protein